VAIALTSKQTTLLLVRFQYKLQAALHVGAFGKSTDPRSYVSMRKRTVYY